MTFVKLFRIAILVAIVVLGMFLVVSTQLTGMRQPAEASTGAPRVGGPFSLVSHDGDRVDNQSLRGRPYVVFFGFTHCPEICPTTLFELTDLMGELGPDADKLEVLFITVDPERDTQDMLAGYMTAFDSRITALRGTAEETEAALAAFSAYAAKVPLEGGQYTMDHTAGVFLMRGDGSLGGILDMHEPRDTRLEKLRRLVSA
jgi:protein SCO1/2